jgi:hypothetical protein
MATLTCKSTVRFRAFTPAMMRMLRGIYRVAETLAEPPSIVVTSANDSTHSANSRHYTDEALDIRTKNLPSEAAARQLVVALREELGPAFTVLYEGAGTPNAHLHLQVRRFTTYGGPI